MRRVVGRKGVDSTPCIYYNNNNRTHHTTRHLFLSLILSPSAVALHLAILLVTAPHLPLSLPMAVVVLVELPSTSSSRPTFFLPTLRVLLFFARSWGLPPETAASSLPLLANQSAPLPFASSSLSSSLPVAAFLHHSSAHLVVVVAYPRMLCLEARDGTAVLPCELLVLTP